MIVITFYNSKAHRLEMYVNHFNTKRGTFLYYQIEYRIYISIYEYIIYKYKYYIFNFNVLFLSAKPHHAIAIICMRLLLWANRHTNKSIQSVKQT